MGGEPQVIEIFGNPDQDPIPLGMKVGNVVQASRIIGTDPETGELGEGIERQLELAYRNMQSLVERAGGTIDNIAQVSFFLKRPEDRQAINKPWVAMFPDEQDRPTYKFMVSDLPGDRLLQMEMFAVLGERREVLNIPGVAHTNPIPMGVKIGNMVLSSRILPYDPETGRPGEGLERQTELVFRNMQTLLEVARARPANISQARVFIVDRSHLPKVERHWNTLFPDERHRPILHSVTYRTGSALHVYVEIIAVL